jgi:diguanylate cyclase (GGDEF)-like protein/PAS domain S-box-containing protein
MDRAGRETESWIAIALGIAVLCVGVVVASIVYDQRAHDSKQRLAAEFEETARQYADQVQRQLDVYAAATQSLAGFVSASDTVNYQEFLSFVRAARYFDRLHGIGALGYVPRVTKSQAAAFERSAARQFPGYRIRDKRPGANVYYPLLYGVHAAGPRRTAELRGVDFSSFPDRLAAIENALATNAPATTPALPALGSPHTNQMLLTFVPATPRKGPVLRGAGGAVFAAMNVRSMFEGVGNGHLATLLDLEVYRVEHGRKTVLYDADEVPHATLAAATPYSYSRQLHYVDQRWALYFFPTPAYLGRHPDRHSPMVLIVGMLLSLIAAYFAFGLARRHLRRHTSAQVADRFDAFFEAHPFAVYALDRERRLVFVNRMMARELGQEQEALLHMPMERFIAPDRHDSTAEHFRQALSGQAVAFSNRFINASGAVSDMAIVLIPVLVQGEVVRVLGFAENVTERKRFQRELYESRQKLQLILDTVPMRVFWKDLNSVYQGANQRVLEEAGLERVEQIVGLTDDDLVWREYAAQYREEDRRIMQGGATRLHTQVSRLHADGSLRWLEATKVPLRDDSGAVVGVLGVARDITESKQMEAELVRRANHDSLTGLPNRAFFYSELQLAIRRAQRQGGELALMYFDIDRFKLINDGFGHDVGDAVIRIFASRVRSVLREVDFVARLGGDEFVLVLENLAMRADAAGVAEKIIATMQLPFAIGDSAHEVSTSIGIAFMEPGMSADRLVKAADDAMYEAKRAGRNCYRTIASEADR